MSEVKEIAKKQIVESFTDEQKNFIFYKGKESIILSSTAGSGKTFSCIRRMKYLIEEKKVKPEKIIFFSYTNAAVDELKERVGNDKVKITTIHSFCLSFLGKIGKFKKPVSFYDFIEWFKTKHKPSSTASKFDRDKFYDRIYSLYEEAEVLSANISAFKLQKAEGLKCRLPDYLNEYTNFLRETRSIDFSDMLIDVRNLLKEDKWLKMFKGKYDYVFIDEYQDTSSIQMDVLLCLNAKSYYLIGDKNQSIFVYSGANCNMVEYALKKRREVIVMNLSTNFRSGRLIVENSNMFSDLKATPSKNYDGIVEKKIILFDQLKKRMLENIEEEIVLLVRTNSVVRTIEKRMLINKVPLRYFNYIKKTDIDDYKKGKASERIIDRLKTVAPAFGYDNDKVVEFIEANKDSKRFVTTIHKSKGREYDVCVVVNNFSPEIMDINKLTESLSKDQIKFYSFDPNDIENYEDKNIHYVAVSRPRHSLYFMIINVE